MISNIYAVIAKWSSIGYKTGGGGEEKETNYIWLRGLRRCNLVAAKHQHAYLSLQNVDTALV